MVATRVAALSAKGGLCTTSGDCAQDAGALYCSDGVCCDNPCTASCDVCTAALGASANGTCTIAPAGYSGSPTCSPYACAGAAGGACATSCASDTACADGYYCATDGTCKPQLARPAACNPANCKAAGCRLCGGGATCADGYCCDTPCDGACQKCSATPGTCTAITSGQDPDTCTSPHVCGGAGVCGVTNGSACNSDYPVMMYQATSSSAATTGKYRAHGFWWAASAVPPGARLLQADDYVEYDVYLPAATPGMGGLDFRVSGTPTLFWRDQADWVDQNGVLGHPSKDISPYAYQRWYHRKLRVPSIVVGRTLERARLAAANDTPSVTLSAYYDNIVITNNGTVVVDIWRAPPNNYDLVEDTSPATYVSDAISFTSTVLPGSECNSGNCADGYCCNTPCTGDCAACNLGTPGICTLKPSTAVCRPAAGPCDVVDYCTGSSATCPTDAKAPTSVVCRPAAGVCDQPENCNGSSIDCPPDAYYSSARTCRPAAGSCDKAETCPGNGPDCLPDQFEPSSTVCRPSAGNCDLPESCTGFTTSCPANTFEAASKVCRPSAGPCDIAEFCTGTSAVCPTDWLLAGSVCRPAAGPCDVAELCTGTVAGCPTDGFAPATKVCRAPASTCELPAKCSGSDIACPTNPPSPTGCGDAGSDATETGPEAVDAGPETAGDGPNAADAETADAGEDAVPDEPVAPDGPDDASAPDVTGQPDEEQAADAEAEGAGSGGSCACRLGGRGEPGAVETIAALLAGAVVGMRRRRSVRSR